MINAGTPWCCESYACGIFVPLVANGNYNGPNGEERTHIRFNITASPFCGIPVAKVLRGDLDGLEGRDDLAELNRNAGSMRLRIEVGNLSPVRSSHKLTCVKSGPVTKSITPRSE